MDSARLAAQRLFYPKSHFRYAAPVFRKIAENKEMVRGFRITYQPQYSFHFTAEVEET
jgi:tryptophanase